MAVKMDEEKWEKISGKMASALAGITKDLTPNERAELLKKSKIKLL